MKLFDSLTIATLLNRLESCSTIAFTKCVVPMVKQAMRERSMADDSRTDRTAISMPSVTFGDVVGVF